MIGALVNAVYGTSGAVARFERAHPGERVIFAGATKAVRTPSEQPVERSVAWVTARRANLVISDRRLVCGDWTIGVDEVAQAELVSIRALLSRAFVLRIATRDGSHFQFGVQDDPRLGAELPFPVARREGRLGYSRGSLALRAAAAAVLVWWVGRQLAWW